MDIESMGKDGLRAYAKEKGIKLAARNVFAMRAQIYRAMGNEPMAGLNESAAAFAKSRGGSLKGSKNASAADRMRRQQASVKGLLGIYARHGIDRAEADIRRDLGLEIGNNVSNSEDDKSSESVEIGNNISINSLNQNHNLLEIGNNISFDKENGEQIENGNYISNNTGTQSTIDDTKNIEKGNNLSDREARYSNVSIEIGNIVSNNIEQIENSNIISNDDAGKIENGNNKSNRGGSTRMTEEGSTRISMSRAGRRGRCASCWSGCARGIGDSISGMPWEGHSEKACRDIPAGLFRLIEKLFPKKFFFKIFIENQDFFFHNINIFT